MSTIFLAGASGAIGRRLAPMLVRAGHRVVGTTRAADKVSSLGAIGIEPVVVDVYDATGLRNAVVKARPDVVIHQLTDLPAGMHTDDMAAALERNSRLREIGTANLVAAARTAGCTRMIAQSLAFVYAPGPLPHLESDPIDPTSRGVLSLEAQVNGGPFAGVILRYGRIWGPGTGFSAPNEFCPVHVDAAAHAAFLAVEKGRGAYNIADDTGEAAIDKARRELRWEPGFRL